MNPNLIKSLWAVALAIGLSFGGTALIKANKVTTTSVERIPMPVAATVFKQQPMFTRNANYLGVIKAGSDSVVGFEVAGVLTDLPATEGMRVSPGDVLAQLGTDRRQAAWTPPPPPIAAYQPSGLKRKREPSGWRSW
ncbi:MAG: hypothetical protein ACPHP8_03270 [Luminiphilus sp.]